MWIVAFGASTAFIEGNIGAYMKDKGSLSVDPRFI
jgi:hypothetical protein